MRSKLDGIEAGAQVNTVTPSNAVTLTNKTLTAPVISSISNTGTLTLPTSTDSLIGRATADTLTHKTFDTADAGNIFKINGAAISSSTGSGANILATSQTPVTPNIGAATGLSLSTTGAITGVDSFQRHRSNSAGDPGDAGQSDSQPLGALEPVASASR
jgi:hypothetical protein